MGVKRKRVKHIHSYVTRVYANQASCSIIFSLLFWIKVDEALLCVSLRILLSSLASKNAECIELPDTSISCRCKKGYVGNGFNCTTGNRFFVSELELNQTFTEPLRDPNSAEYRNLAQKIENALTNAIRKGNTFQGFLGCQVTSFRPGSVVAEYIVIFQLQDGKTVDVSKLSQVIHMASQNGSLAGSPKNITVTGALKSKTIKSCRSCQWIGVPSCSFSNTNQIIRKRYLIQLCAFSQCFL